MAIFKLKQIDRLNIVKLSCQRVCVKYFSKVNFNMNINTIFSGQSVTFHMLHSI